MREEIENIASRKKLRVTGYDSRSNEFNNLATHRWRCEGVAGFFLVGACAKSLVAIDGRYELVT